MSDRPILSTRQLNRSLLARQGLLHRAPVAVTSLLRHLVGLQAQVPSDPYVALWSRIEGFAPPELEALLLDRSVARAPLLRSTIHLATAADCLGLRPLVQPVLDRAFRANFARRLPGITPEELVAAGRELLSGEPKSLADLRETFGETWPGVDPSAAGYSISYLLR